MHKAKLIFHKKWKVVGIEMSLHSQVLCFSLLLPSTSAPVPLTPDVHGSGVRPASSEHSTADRCLTLNSVSITITFPSFSAVLILHLLEISLFYPVHVLNTRILSLPLSCPPAVSRVLSRKFF